MKQVRDDFAPFLGEVEAELLERPEALVLGLHADFTIGFVNTPWLQAAAETGGEEFSQRWGLGANYLHGVYGRARAFYRHHFEEALETGQPWTHDYECPAVDVLLTFRLEVRPIADGEALLVTHRRLDARPLVELGADLSADAAAKYLSADGIVAQCCHCRRYRVAGTEDEWNWVPAFIASPPAAISHGICEQCLERFY